MSEDKTFKVIFHAKSNWFYDKVDFEFEGTDAQYEKVCKNVKIDMGN